MTINRERAVEIGLILLVVIVVIMAIISNWGPSPAEKVRAYSDCENRMIEAGNSWADVVAICESKRP